MFKLKWAAASLAFAVVLWHFTEDRSGTGIVSTVSIESSHTDEIIRREQFSFEKSGSVKFDFSEKVIEQKLSGKLFIDWTNEKVATVSLQVGHAHSAVYLRAQFQNDFQLKCVEFPQNLTESENDSITLLRDLLFNYSFRTNWDENGEYQAFLNSTTSRSGDTLLTKVKKKYLDPEKESLRVEQSRHEIRLSPRLVTAQGSEEYFVENVGQSAWAKVKYSLTALKENQFLSFSKTERPLGECLKDFLPTTQLNTFSSPVDMKENLNQLKVSSRGEQLTLSRKIVKAMRTNPQLSALALGMLGNLGTPEAQKALVGLFQEASDGPGHIHYQVLNSLTLTKAALTHESREFLKSRMHESDLFTEGAAYALGSSIQNNNEALEGQRDLQFLVSELDQAMDSESKIIYLDALKNSGSADAFATYKKYSVSDDEGIREKAIEALQTIESQEKILIYKNALNDPSPRVRAQAIEGLSVVENKI
jgi:hypothetical protein